MAIALTLFALLLGAVGLINLTQATLGVGLVGMACLFAIIARLAQAHRHHRLSHPTPTLQPLPERDVEPVVFSPG